MSNKFFFFLIVLFLPVALMLSTFHLLLHNEPFYLTQLREGGAIREFGEPLVKEKIHELWNYFRGTGQLSPFFNEKEKRHLADVSRLLSQTRTVFWISFLIVIVSAGFLRRHKRLFSLALLSGSLLTLALLLSLFVVPFDRLFLSFHQLAFSNEDWLLTPDTDNLIRLFPPVFFHGFVAAILRQVAVLALFGLLAGLLLVKEGNALPHHAP